MWDVPGPQDAHMARLALVFIFMRWFCFSEGLVSAASCRKESAMYVRHVCSFTFARYVCSRQSAQLRGCTRYPDTLYVRTLLLYFAGTEFSWNFLLGLSFIYCCSVQVLDGERTGFQQTKNDFDKFSAQVRRAEREN